MCGIFGVVADRDAPYSHRFLRRSLTTLAQASQSRGKDSSGLVFYNEALATYHVIKGALKLSELLRARAVNLQLQRALTAYAADGPRAPFAAIGHSRLVTNGTQLDDENNQPIVKNDLVDRTRANEDKPGDARLSRGLNEPNGAEHIPLDE